MLNDAIGAEFLLDVANRLEAGHDRKALAAELRDKAGRVERKELSHAEALAARNDLIFAFCKKFIGVLSIHKLSDVLLEEFRQYRARYCFDEGFLAANPHCPGSKFAALFDIMKAAPAEQIPDTLHGFRKILLKRRKT